MKRILTLIKNFFFPPTGSPRLVRLLPYVVLGALTMVVIVTGAFAWDYTNSPGFCGETCHTMPPEYSAYLVSPHARVDCVDCHIGKGFIATRVTRKSGDLKHVYATLFNTYNYPIFADELRPARETCERCHFPEKFSDDSLREIKHINPDKENSQTTLYLVLKTGGGSKRLGLGRGIHWHIENQVYFLPSDEREQEIPYVRVVQEDGSITEYVDIDSGIKSEEIKPDELELMDCITCHNRITHLVPTPEATVEKLITVGIISTDIPEIRKKAVEVYAQLYDDVQLGLNGIAGLESYYQQYYPEFHAANSSKIQSVVVALQDAYQKSVFPDQQSNWSTHPNNIGHKDTPGCFRCHDGKHLNSNQEAIRLECNLCHSIPVVVRPAQFVANIEISRGPEPQSHLNPNWISLHHSAFDQTCANCHTTENPGGTDNSSFCSNSGCHGYAWKFAGFDAPKLREILRSQFPPTPTPLAPPSGGALTYETTLGPLLVSRCASCHGPSANIQGLDLTSYQAVMKGGNSGVVIMPGDPDNSLLVQKQSGTQPHFSQLSPEELKLVRDWIAKGAPER